MVLAGGAARRMGGVDKPAVPVGGQPMRDRVLDAVADASPRIVVGPAAGLPAGVLATREEPLGGGPVAAAAAGVALLGPATTTVALLAGDLPLLTAGAVRLLRRHLAFSGARATAGDPIAVRADAAVGADGACFVDADGRRQWLCGVWRVGPLRAALAALAASNRTLGGASMRSLFADLSVNEVSWTGTGPPPWFDCDTDQDVRRAERWTR
ncbi:MAG TPA: NTP transferase domain-containing protein [Micromonosporaceae bacterium]|nr:NTP transferase domain-containing protein [Micromonosporaceae bacterium]